MLFSWLAGCPSLLNGRHPPHRKSDSSSFRNRHRATLRVEQLEDRCVPATFHVANLLDNGFGSLRQAILDANASADVVNQIDFPNPGLTGTISLTAALPTLEKTLNIDGPGASSLTVQRSTAVGTPWFRIFNIDDGATVWLDGMTLTNGDVRATDPLGGDGGGIRNAGNLTLNNVVVQGNSATRFGGGIYNLSHISGNGVTLHSNTALSQGGGLFNEEGTFAYFYSGFVVTSNTTTGGDGGGIYNDRNATLLAISATISGNSAGMGGHGGGIYNAGSLTLQSSSLQNNNASGYGGGLYSTAGTSTIQGTSIQGNSARSGGGFYLSTGDLSLENCTISGNSLLLPVGVGRGGAYRAGATYQATNCTITDPIEEDKRP